MRAPGGELARAGASGPDRPPIRLEAFVQRGFLGSLFDLSFTSFVTTRLMKVLYVLRLMLLGGTYLVGAFAAFGVGGSALGALWLFVFGPFVLAAQTLANRVACELVVVLFRIFEHTRDQLEITQAAWSAAAAAGQAPPPAPPV
jgi:hypothetical protein